MVNHGWPWLTILCVKSGLVTYWGVLVSLGDPGEAAVWTEMRLYLLDPYVPLQRTYWLSRLRISILVWHDDWWVVWKQTFEISFPETKSHCMMFTIVMSQQKLKSKISWKIGEGSQAYVLSTHCTIEITPCLWWSNGEEDSGGEKHGFTHGNQQLRNQLCSSYICKSTIYWTHVENENFKTNDTVDIWSNSYLNTSSRLVRTVSLLHLNCI